MAASEVWEVIIVVLRSIGKKPNPTHPMKCQIYLAILLLTGCTAINHNHPAGDPPKGVSIGILRDVTLDPGEINTLLNEAQNFFWHHERVVIVWAWVKPWHRPGFGHKAILKDVWRQPFNGADKVLALVGRHPGDFAWGLIMPEVNGAVFKNHQKGFAVAEWGSLNQVVSFCSPRRVIIHEIYHLLGYTD